MSWDDYGYDEEEDFDPEEAPEDVCGVVVAVTAKAILVREGKDDNDPQWWPKSQITPRPEPNVGDEIKFQVPGWLFYSKGRS